MITQDVRPIFFESAYVKAPFDKAKAELEANGYKIISLEQFAKLRKDHSVANGGAYAREGFLYVPRRGVFLVRNSPILYNAKEATQCGREGKEFYLTSKQVEESLENSVQFKNSKSIPTKRFGDDERTRFAFGETAREYGEFLKEAGIDAIPIELAKIGDKPFAIQAWFCGLGSNSHSGLSGEGYLDGDLAVRGIRWIGGKK